MGVFDFVKSAGEKLFELNPGAKAADIIMDQVRKHKLGGTDVKVQHEGETVKVSGTASSQAEKEKIILAAGNVQGVGRVDEDIKVAPTPAAKGAEAAAPAEPPAQFYTVVKGDTLSKISKQFYGSAQKYNRIFEANRPMLKHPDKIYPGQVLRVPAKE